MPDQVCWLPKVNVTARHTGNSFENLRTFRSCATSHQSVNAAHGIKTQLHTPNMQRAKQQKAVVLLCQLPPFFY
jgi:hypothetical protein